MVYWAMLDRGHPSKNVIQLSRAAHERYLGPLSASFSKFPPTLCRYGIPEERFQHCWDAKSSEPTFMQELVEMCYREKTFEFRQQDIYLLPAFLGKGSLPRGAPLQNTIVPIEQVGRLRLCVRPTGNGWKFTLKTLRLLLELKRRAKIELIMDTPLVILTGEEDIDRAIRIYESLFPLLASMRGRGHIVDVRFGVIQVRPPAIGICSAAEWSDAAQKKLNEYLASARPWIPSEKKGLSGARRGRAKSAAVAKGPRDQVKKRPQDSYHAWCAGDPGIPKA
ncbi:uncharacterized protein N0V89_008135 [Didymosphaeria variabile]|uniref:Uncharacterized protein n=1 Tax=Didymosphaeria variabile TaxID=1932322 RepID=A0A9W9C8A6_9PLEO|nr:uncharacterized protein N0V89_008135 [Didymosphaeria variabile]KAJ4349519.1 hypothetical protein N0V89_008135 [Didymosphaeria variabile]